MSVVRGSIRLHLAIASLGIIAMTVAVSPAPARACSFAGPVGFVGHAVLVDIRTTESRTVSFSDVGIGAGCEITNRMDLDGETAMVQLDRGVHLFSLAGDAGQADLPTPRAVFPDLDGGFVYYVDTADESLHRLNLGTRAEELLLDRADLLGSSSWPSDLFVQGGTGVWLRWESGVPFLGVYDMANRTFLFRGEPPLALPASHSLELIGVQGSRVTFAAEDALVRFDALTNLSVRVGRIPPFAAHLHSVRQDGDRIAYVENETLRILDLASNATQDTGLSLPGENLAFAGSLVSYNYYETIPYFIILPVVAVVAVVAVIVCVVVATTLVRRRRAHR